MRDVLKDGGLNAGQDSHKPLLKPKVVVAVCEGGKRRTEVSHCSGQHGALHLHGDV